MGLKEGSVRFIRGIKQLLTPEQEARENQEIDRVMVCISEYLCQTCHRFPDVKVWGDCQCPCHPFMQPKEEVFDESGD